VPEVARRRPVISQDGYQRRHRPDYSLLVFSSILLALGLVVVYAISPGLAQQNNVSDNYYVYKQLTAVVMGIVMFIIAANLPTKIWRNVQWLLIGLSAIASVAVLVFGGTGHAQHGAYRWIQIGGFSFQAAELIKLALLIWLAGFLADHRRQGTLADNKITFKPLLIALALVLVVVAKVQSDLGSAVVMLGMMGAMALIIGLPLKRIALIGVIIAAGVVLLISSTAYRRERFLTFVHPTRDCLDAGYQSCQALIAVGSGGMAGRGLAHSVQDYGYLPETASDSIFAIFAEKFGFIGSVIVIGLFLGLFLKIKRIAERAPDDYNRLLVVGVLAWLSVQAFINIGAMIGLLPLKGITLPLISYGGTSMIFVAVAIGIVFQVSRYTSYGPVTQPSPNERPVNENRIIRRR
jgi:cell division protein FtsW